jgi:Ca-activated chloride channel family protein
VAARRAAARIVDGLSAGDRVAVFAFDDRTDRPTGLATGLAAASDRHRFAAVEFLAGLEARGGTEMQRPLAEAAALLAADRSDRERVLVLVTDGQVGQEDVVLAALAPHLEAVRVFALGIDQAVNAGFLGRLAAMSGGRCELVESEDRLDEAMTAIHRQIAVPVVAGLTMDLGGAELMPGTLAPARPPDCTEGSPSVLAARYRAASTGPIVVRLGGTAADGNRWSDRVQAVVVSNPAVRATWARSHVRDLEDRYATNVEPPAAQEALASAIVDASLAHGVLSRFTAFVAVDPTRPDEPVVTPHRIIQPVEVPAGWAAPAAMAAAPAGGVVRRMARMSAATEASMPPAPAPATWPAMWARVEEILRRIEQGAPVDAGELDRLVDELRTASAPGKVIAAVAALAAGVRDQATAGELSRLAGDVRALRPGRRRFWKGG